MKLYDKDAKFIISVPTPSKRIPALTHYNSQGLYVRSQFNASMTKLVRSYVQFEVVDPNKVIRDMEKKV